MPRILICDYVGLNLDESGQPSSLEVQRYIEKKSGVFHQGLEGFEAAENASALHFFYLPELVAQEEILALTDQGQFDAVIAAASFIPESAKFKMGGVRIGAGTGNMKSASWGGANGIGGAAPLMNTPGFNARATAQMAFKALMMSAPNLPLQDIHSQTIAGKFDTGRDLKLFPTQKLEGQTLAVLGFGNIGKEFAKLAKAFHINVKVFARPPHQKAIEALGFTYAATPVEAAKQADILSIHLGLGIQDLETKKFSNQNFIGAEILSAMNHHAVLINFDRGEVVDVAALETALATDQIRFAAIDADIFSDGENITGPLAPYVPLAKKFPKKLLLLPHVAADTDHPSRVAGAKQAVDQIFAAILEKRVVNVKGDLPAGYSHGGFLQGV